MKKKSLSLLSSPFNCTFKVSFVPFFDVVKQTGLRARSLCHTVRHGLALFVPYRQAWACIVCAMPSVMGLHCLFHTVRHGLALFVPYRQAWACISVSLSSGLLEVFINTDNAAPRASLWFGVFLH